MAQELTISLKEIHCENCERRISAAVSQLPGVLRAQASSKTNDVVVRLQGSKTTEQDIRDKLVELGYEPND